MAGNETERDALARFEALLGAYGAEPRRWPADRRAWAEALLARSAAAQSMRAEALRLDGLIDAAGVDAVPAHLVGRALAAAPRPAPRRAAWLAGFLQPATGLAMAAVLGLALGVVVSPFAAGNGELAEAETVMLDIGDLPEAEL
jgi:hypothetical protein